MLCLSLSFFYYINHPLPAAASPTSALPHLSEADQVGI